MKKTKVYRPRRGMRFSNGRRGISPTAGFVGGEPLTRSRPTGPRANLDGDDSIANAFHGEIPSPFPGVDSVLMTGSVMVSTQQVPLSYEPFSPVIASSSMALQGSISMGRLYERSKLNASLISAPTNNLGGILPGVTPWPSPTVMDVGQGGASPGIPSGTTIGGGTIRTTPPSWTHSYLGVNQAFVIGTLTASNFNDITLNTFTSGTEVLESSPIVVSVAQSFSKESRFQTIIVKKTASFFDTVQRSGSWSPTVFSPVSGAFFTSVIGTPDLFLSSYVSAVQQDSSVWTPCSILIPVNFSGRLVDLKVWLECIQGSGTNGTPPLAAFGASLRSPNLSWGHAHPIRNDPRLLRAYTAQGGNFSPLCDGGELYKAYFAGTGSYIDQFYRDTFILWEGPSIFDVNVAYSPSQFNGAGIDGGVFQKSYPCWNKDRGIRTIFSDGASTLNPRHHNGPMSGNFPGSPNAGAGRNNAYGSDVPWTSDATVRGSTTFVSAGSPPIGWLTGLGGVTASVNEWPTTGVNWGTNTIRPLYPLLDPVTQTKRVTPEVNPQNSGSDDFRPDLWVGTRPGLRGTEVSGTWELLLLCGGSPSNFVVDNMFFRQVRLEFTIETPSYTRPKRISRRRNPVRAGSRLISSISGSDAAIYPVGALSPRAGWDAWISDQSTATDSAGEVDRSFGIALNDGTAPASTALLYRLTGSLAAIVGQTPSWLLSGRGGMPVLPESSSSLVTIMPQPVAATTFADFIQPRRDLDLTQLLTNIASDVNPQKSLRELSESFVASSTGSTT